MRITFDTRKFGNVERNSHCDVVHITPIRVANLVLDCNGVFAIKAYGYCLSCRDPEAEGAMKNLSHFGHLRLAGMTISNFTNPNHDISLPFPFPNPPIGKLNHKA